LAGAFIRKLGALDRLGYRLALALQAVDSTLGVLRQCIQFKLGDACQTMVCVHCSLTHSIRLTESYLGLGKGDRHFRGQRIRLIPAIFP
jgi:hypothetical protein